MDCGSGLFLPSPVQKAKKQTSLFTSERRGCVGEEGVCYVRRTALLLPCLGAVPGNEGGIREACLGPFYGPLILNICCLLGPGNRI